METKTLFNEVLGKKEGHLRGISVGENAEKVVGIEGSGFRKKRLPTPNYRYFSSVGKCKLTLNYYFEKEADEIRRIQCYLSTNLFQAYGYEGEDKKAKFKNLLENKEALKTVTQEIDSIKEGFVKHFTEKYGDPETGTRKDPVGPVSMYTWCEDATGIKTVLQYYTDTILGGGDIAAYEQALKIEVYKF